jgi:hypothetical protein
MMKASSINAIEVVRQFLIIITPTAIEARAKGSCKGRGTPGVTNFFDPLRVIAEDLDHCGSERRYFCFGRIEDAVVTVRFTWRNRKIGIFGAGYWRKGKAIYEKANDEIQQR